MALGALGIAGCFDFAEDLQICHQTGGCSRDGGEPGDSGMSDAGATDGGPRDAGGSSDGGPRLVTSPVFFTTSGWGWEFPFPAGPGLHSVAAVSDNEAWATGDDDSVLHYVDGGVTFLRLSPPPTRTIRGGFVVGLSDGGLVIVDGTHVYVQSGAGWAQSAFALEAASAELGLGGVPWFGGQGACSPAGAAVVEGVSPGTPICAADAGSAGSVVGLDPLGWGLDTAGNVLRRELDGGRWAAVARSNSGGYARGDVLALSGDDVLVVGLDIGSSVVLSLDGGKVPVKFAPLTKPEDWTSLLRTRDQQGFFVAGRPGIYRCQVAVPLVEGQCSLEFTDESGTLEALADAPNTLFGVGDNGQLIRREQDAGWSTLYPGGVGSLNDVWADPNGELWAVANGGWLLHTTAGGWERIRVSTKDLRSVTRTSDGLLWLAGEELLASYDPGSNSLIAASISTADGGPFTLASSGKVLASLSGTEPGNTWVGGAFSLLGYLADGTWREVSLPRPQDSISDVWASDAGTAWAVGGYNSRLVMFWDGVTWQDRTPTGMGQLQSVWGPNGNEVFVSGTQTGYRFFPDGGVGLWNHQPATSLSGAVTDAGFVVFGGAGTQAWRARNGTGPVVFETNAPNAGYMTRLRVLGSKIFVSGSRDGNHSVLLSLDAGL